MLNRLNPYIIFFLLIICGCDKVSITKPVELTKEVKEISSAMQHVDSDKCALMYKQFAGLSEYMKHSGKKVDTTPKVFKLIDGFQTDYSYTREGNKEYTDAVETFLKSRGYLKPKKVVDSVIDTEKEVARDTVVADMKMLAEAAKVALENKSVK